MDYFSQNRRRERSSTQERLNTPQARPESGAGEVAGGGGDGATDARPPSNPRSLESMRTPSHIRIRRFPSSQNVNQATTAGATQQSGQRTPGGGEDTAVTGRRRSSSEPQRPSSYPPNDTTDLSRQRTADAVTGMPTVAEESPATPTAHFGPGPPPDQNYWAQQGNYAGTEQVEPPRDGTYTPSTSGDGATPSEPGAAAIHRAGNAARSNRGLQRFRTGGTAQLHRGEQTDPNEYGSDVVDLLDLVDPEVSTLGTLTNVQNSLFIPDLGKWVNRRPTYDISKTSSAGGPSTPRAGTPSSEKKGLRRTRTGTMASRLSGPPADLPSIPQGHQLEPSKNENRERDDEIEMQSQRPASTHPDDADQHRLSISSSLSESRYAVLPHGVSLNGWSEEDKADLDDHVRHLLHSRREGIKRSWKGFVQYISKPLGFFVFVYATLITLFGTAWVIFLIGWIYVGDEQSYAIEVIDNILVALFAVMGDGLAPFRAVDTYHMCFIARYYHRTWRVRSEKHLPQLADHNDLPDRRNDAQQPDDPEEAINKETAEFSVLKPLQQRRLQYHQAKFSKAHTFYRPHETATHHAFPLRLLVAVVVLLDFHSIFQVALGTCTWSIDYKNRPGALTAVILTASLTCNITAGILISIGDKRTRKKDVFERMFRQQLTEEAVRRVVKDRRREGKRGIKDGAGEGEGDATDGEDGETRPRTTETETRKEREDEGKRHSAAAIEEADRRERKRKSRTMEAQRTFTGT